ncbi:MAG: hypothetical protein AAGJ35_08440, partial [Myxococcota bacterium]
MERVPSTSEHQFILQVAAHRTCVVSPFPELKTQFLQDLGVGYIDAHEPHTFTSIPTEAPWDRMLVVQHDEALAQRDSEILQKLSKLRNAHAVHAAQQKQYAAFKTAQHSRSFTLEHTPKGSWFLQTTSVGWIPLEGPARLLVASSTFPKARVQQFWKVVFQQDLRRAGGLLLHASGLVVHGQAYLFAGPSGSGKTTAVWNAPPEASV